MEGATYTPLYMGRRAAIGTIIFIKQGVHVSQLATGNIGVGLGGVYGNKGKFRLIITNSRHVSH
jgi:hypothetical protein